jgi:putative transcriptional regulator
MLPRIAIPMILAAGMAAAQQAPFGLAPGKFLVASKELGDPNFMQTVVLLTKYDKRGAMGVIVNRPTRLRLASVFDKVPAAKERTDPVYSGGPVGREGAMALVRADKKPPDSEPVLADIYLTGSLGVVEKMLKENAPATDIRVFLGYSGWGPGQLESEMERGAWHVLPADLGSVFDPKPETLWRRLLRRTDLQIAYGQTGYRRPRPPSTAIVWPVM